MEAGGDQTQVVSRDVALTERGGGLSSVKQRVRDLSDQPRRCWGCGRTAARYPRTWFRFGSASHQHSQSDSLL